MRLLVEQETRLGLVEALTNDELIHEAPAIVGCRTPSALAHGSTPSPP
jgi:hypothetical protein